MIEMNNTNNIEIGMCKQNKCFLKRKSKCTCKRGSVRMVETKRGESEGSVVNVPQEPSMTPQTQKTQLDRERTLCKSFALLFIFPTLPSFSKLNQQRGKISLCSLCLRLSAVCSPHVYISPQLVEVII